MVTRRPRDIGTAAESAVVRYLRTAGYPHAERRALHGTTDLGDITGTPGIAWEVKAGAAAKTASDAQVTAWLAETETERANAAADIGVLILTRAGVGPANADRWWAITPSWAWARLLGLDPWEPAWEHPVRMHLRDTTTLLRRYGLGEPLPPQTATLAAATP